MDREIDVKIFQYLTEIEMQKPEVAMMLMEKISKHQDIKQSFHEWLEDEDFAKSSLKVNGYSPIDIARMAPFLSGIGVFLFMVTLRDEPEKAKKIISEGFRRM